MQRIMSPNLAQNWRLHYSMQANIILNFTGTGFSSRKAKIRRMSGQLLATPGDSMKSTAILFLSREASMWLFMHRVLTDRDENPWLSASRMVSTHRTSYELSAILLTVPNPFGMSLEILGQFPCCSIPQPRWAVRPGSAQMSAIRWDFGMQAVTTWRVGSELCKRRCHQKVFRSCTLTNRVPNICCTMAAHSSKRSRILWYIHRLNWCLYQTSSGRPLTWLNPM